MMCYENKELINNEDPRRHFSFVYKYIAQYEIIIKEEEP